MSPAQAMSPEKARAWGRWRYALKSGKVVRPDVCSRADEECAGGIEGHHPDLVADPLEVIWLCQWHHLAEHGAKRKKRLR